jgi:hypothetical protein
MTDVMEPLQELARTAEKWKRHRCSQNACVEATYACAVELESLLPALSSAIAEHKCSVCGTPTGLACSDCRIDLQTTVYVCQSADCRDEHEKKCPHALEAELAALTEKMAACGHAKACWREAQPAPSIYMEAHCTACEEKRLERAAVLRDIVALYQKMTHQDPADQDGDPDAFVAELLSRLSWPDRSALDAHDAETWNQALEEAAKGFDNLYWGIHSNEEAAECVRKLKRGSK